MFSFCCFPRFFFQPAGVFAYVMDKGLPFMKSQSSVGTFIRGGVAEAFADWYKHWRHSVHAELFPLLQCNFFLAVQSMVFF